MRMPSLIIRALLLLVPLVAYSSALSNGFVWDDHKTIEHGRLIGSLRNIPQLYLHDAMYNSVGSDFARTAKVDTYRPLSLTLFFMERASFGQGPRAFHLDSVLLHVLNVLLLFAVAGRLGLSLPAATMAALLFAVHPAISEAVHWINGRADPLCLCFFLSSLWLWLGTPSLSSSRMRLLLRFSAVALLVFAATLSKEIAFLLLLPVFLLLPRLGARGRAAVLALSPWVAGAALGLLCRLLALRHAAVAANAGHLRYALVRIPLIWLDGLRSLVLPVADLQPSLFETYFHISSIRLVFAVAVVLLLVGIAAQRWWRGQDLIAWGWGSFLMTMAPVSLLTFDEGWPGWGRYLYVSAALLSLGLMALLWDGLLLRARAPLRIAGVVVFSLIIMMLGLETFLSGHSWHDDRSLALGQIADHPELSTGYSSLAVVEANQGHQREALALLDKAILLAPAENYQHYSRRAWALIKLGRRQEAFAAADQALRLEPGDANARYIKALELIGKRQQAQAAQVLLMLLAEDPDYVGPWETLRSAIRIFGPQSEFTMTLQAALSDPRYAEIALRVRELL